MSQIRDNAVLKQAAHEIVATLAKHSLKVGELEAVLSLVKSEIYCQIIVRNAQ